MKFGTTLFSHTLEWLSRQYTLEQLLARIHAEGIGPGLEIIGFQTIRHFPHVSDAFARELRDLMDKYELTPTCLDANIDVALRRDRPLTVDETVEYVAAQIAAAQKLGFPVLRVQMTAKPEVMRKLAPIAERANVKLGMELHSPYANHHPAVIALRELYEEMDSPALGYIPDFGTTMRDIPPGLLDSFRHEGMPETLLELIKEIWHAELPTPEKFAQMQVRASAMNATPQQLGRLNMSNYSRNI